VLATSITVLGQMSSAVATPSVDGDPEEAAMTRPRTTFAALTAVSAMTLATGCFATGGTDRAGGETLVLKMATIDGFEFGTTGGFLTGPETFATALEEVSGGKMRVDVTTNYGEGDPGAESELVEAIADGELDGGWPATRAFSAAGIRSLEAIEAPLQLTSETAVQQLLTGHAGQTAIDSLGDTGITGLAMLHGGLRRPFANRMLLSPEDWAGARMRVFGSPVQRATVTALGAEPVETGTRWIDLVKQDKLDGAEFTIDLYAHNGYGEEAGNVPLNVVLWPKVFVLSLSTDLYASLSDQQHAWVAEATDAAVEQARYAAPAEDEFLPDLCSSGVNLATAAGWQLQQLRAKVEPVLQDLQHTPETAPLMKAVGAIAARYPRADIPEKPADCSSASADAPPRTDSNLPSGVWRVAIPIEDVASASLDNEPGWSGVWTLTVEDATFVLACAPLEDRTKDCGNTGIGSANFEAGYLKGDDSTVFFVADGELMEKSDACHPDCHVLDPYSAQWQVEGDTLTFTAAEGSHLTINPWTRIK
jgi:TRAP-type C4-dicarboxylate transport system substrate-binding protein